MSRRFYDPQPFHVGQTVALSEGPSHHIGKVLRMRVGDALTVFNGEGGEYTAVLTEVGKRVASIELLSFNDINRTPNLNVTLALPLIKGERMDYAIQKSTEMGARHFHLLQCERSDVRLNGEREAKKMAHFQQVAISACEQCGMNIVPTFSGISSLNDFLLKNTAELSLIAHPGLSPITSQTLQSGKDVTLLTGPEGGFSDGELEQAAQSHFIPFTLGSRVLRAETAPVALLSALWALTQ
jgi:16S rRNA (uracil1498-N3)-methyltransferase